jgi:hypothetical protein
MNKCSYCGAEYPDDVLVCPTDQTPLKDAPLEPVQNTPITNPNVRRLDSASSTVINKWTIYIFLAAMWGITIHGLTAGNQNQKDKVTIFLYVLPLFSVVALWWLCSFKQVTLDGDTLIIRSSRREARVLISQVKQIKKRNGKMSSISIVFKSETEFGRCVRIFTFDVEKNAKILQAAMEGKDVVEKMNHAPNKSSPVSNPTNDKSKEIRPAIAIIAGFISFWITYGCLNGVIIGLKTGKIAWSARGYSGVAVEADSPASYWFHVVEYSILTFIFGWITFWMLRHILRGLRK